MVSVRVLHRRRIAAQLGIAREHASALLDSAADRQELGLNPNPRRMIMSWIGERSV
jgi:hypothetical protein